MFRRRHELYFWSCLLCSWGVLIQPLATILEGLCSVEEQACLYGSDLFELVHNGSSAVSCSIL